MNREKKTARGGNLEKLIINGKIEEDRQKVEKEVTNFSVSSLMGVMVKMEWRLTSRSSPTTLI